MSKFNEFNLQITATFRVGRYDSYFANGILVHNK